LGWGDRDGAIGLCDVPDGGLRSWGEASNEEGDSGEGAPGAWEVITVDVGIDGGDFGLGVVWV